MLAPALFIFVLLGIVRLLRVGRRPGGYPPGPPTIPILGNAHLMPKKDVFLQFQKWAEQYGPIYSLILGTRTYIILSSGPVVKELLDYRSAIYSSRPDLYVVGHLASNGNRMGFMEYGPMWRMLRKMIHTAISITVATAYLPYQDLESKQMLFELLSHPDTFSRQIERYASSVVTQMTYGIRIVDIHDPKLIQFYDDFHEFCALADNPAAIALDMWPILRKIPNMLLPICRYAIALGRKDLGLRMHYWKGVKEAINAGTAKPCICVEFVKIQEKENLSDDILAQNAGTIFEAGSDTTTSTLVGFMQAMILYPEIQKRAQMELDAVIGSDRLPVWDDLERLRYIRCLIKETLRWTSVAPMGIPHATLAEDHYMGYTIPAGATVIGNIWSLNRDPSRYSNPNTFDPTRFAHDTQSAFDAAINADVSKRDHFNFGHGRRVCSGMHIAERMLYLAISRILWAFDIAPSKDEHGNNVMPNPTQYDSGLTLKPKPFKTNIMPRSKEREDLVRRVWEECENDVLDEERQWKKTPEGLQKRFFL